MISTEGSFLPLQIACLLTLSALSAAVQNPDSGAWDFYAPVPGKCTATIWKAFAEEMI